MAMVRVWNITDNDNPDTKSQNRMVLGKMLKPGQAVQVDERQLARAHKVNADQKAGMLHYGNRPPASYQSMKKPPRAKLDARIIGADGKPAPGQPRSAIEPGRAHGPTDGVLKEAPPAVELTDEVKVEDSVSAELKPAETSSATEAPSEDTTVVPTGDDSSSGSSRKRRGSRKG